MLREGSLSSASWRWGEGRWFTQSTQIEFLFIDCSAVLCANSETSYKLVKCSATEVQPSPGTSFLLVNFPFLANHYHRKEGLLFCCWCLVLLQGNSVQFTRPICPSLPLPTAEEGLEDNCNLGGEILPTLPTYSFSLVFWTWPILKRKRLLSAFVSTHQPQTISIEWGSRCSMDIWSRASNPMLVLSSETASSWALEAGHLTWESTSLAISLVYLTFRSREWQGHTFIFSHF